VQQVLTVDAHFVTGAVINAAIKSGTNSFHGDAWEYWRNDVLNANLYFYNNKPKPGYRQNLFGGTFWRSHQEGQDVLLR
jgi:hypothetical protein